MMQLKKISLDTRELEHPVPMQKAMEVLKVLDQTNYLHMIHKKNPIPLVDLAKENQFQVLVHEESENFWHILISKNRQTPLSEFLDV